MVSKLRIILYSCLLRSFIYFFPLKVNMYNGEKIALSLLMKSAAKTINLLILISMKISRFMEKEYTLINSISNLRNIWKYVISHYTKYFIYYHSRLAYYSVFLITQFNLAKEQHSKFAFIRLYSNRKKLLVLIISKFLSSHFPCL